MRVDKDIDKDKDQDEEKVTEKDKNLKSLRRRARSKGGEGASRPCRDPLESFDCAEEPKGRFVWMRMRIG